MSLEHGALGRAWTAWMHGAGTVALYGGLDACVPGHAMWVRALRALWVRPESTGTVCPVVLPCCVACWWPCCAVNAAAHGSWARGAVGMSSPQLHGSTASEHQAGSGTVQLTVAHIRHPTAGQSGTAAGGARWRTCGRGTRRRAGREQAVRAKERSCPGKVLGASQLGAASTTVAFVCDVRRCRAWCSGP
jgi:hypothetical protein